MVNPPLSSRVGPYRAVSRNEVVEFPHRRAFRLILYSAYDALGLIGYEHNGIAVLDEDKRAVVCDEISIEPSGYPGPSMEQLNAFERILAMPWPAFKTFINDHPRNRYVI